MDINTIRIKNQRSSETQVVVDASGTSVNARGMRDQFGAGLGVGISVIESTVVNDLSEVDRCGPYGCMKLAHAGQHQSHSRQSPSAESKIDGKPGAAFNKA